MYSQQHQTIGHRGVLVSLMLPLTLVGCSNDFMKSAVKNQSFAVDELAVVQDEAGNYVAGFTSDSNATQVLRTSLGASIMVPPGSLSIPVTLTVGAGESLATSELASSLGLTGNNATSAGPSVSFIPSANIEATNPFSLSIPFGSSAGLGLDGITNVDWNRVVVAYRWMVIKDGEVSYELGVLAPKSLKFSSSHVTFTTRKFGTFQIALLDKAITDKVAVKSDQPPTMIQSMGSPLEGRWSTCGQSRAGKEINRVGHTCVMPKISPNEQIEIFGGPSFLARSSNNASRYQGFSLNFQPGFRFGRGPIRNSFASSFDGVTNSHSGTVTDIALEVSGLSSLLYLNESDALFIETRMDALNKLLFGSGDQRSRIAPLVQSRFRPAFFNPGGPNYYYLTVDRGKVPDGTTSPDPAIGFFMVDQQVGPLSPSRAYAYQRLTPYKFKVFDMAVPLISGNRSAIDFHLALSGANRNFNVQFLHPMIFSRINTQTFLSPLSELKVGDEFVVAATYSASFDPSVADSLESETRVRVSEVVQVINGYQIKFWDIAANAVFEVASNTTLVVLPANLDGVYICNPFEMQNSELVEDVSVNPSDHLSPIAATGAIPNSLLFTSGDIEELGLAPGQDYFARELLTIGRGFFSFRKLNFEGANCTGSIVSEYSERGSFEASLGDDDFYDVDLVFKDRNITLRQPLAVVRTNAAPQNACGISNWNLGVPRSFMNEGSCVTEMQSKIEDSLKLKVDGSKLIIDDDEPGKEPFSLERVKE